MNILFVAAEVAPVAKVGGMGDVVGTLTPILRKMGHDVRILMPYYGFLPDKLDIPETPVWQGSAMFQTFDIFETLLPGTEVPLYLLGHPAFAPRRIYHGDDEPWRFTFFANGAAQLALNYWQPDVIHCHDWHTGMIPVWMHQSPEIKTVFTIHNLAYQGPARSEIEQIAWCPPYMQENNVMAGAIQFADCVNTVSPTYAQQIQTPEYGEGLDKLLALKKDKIVGIVNGIDVNAYNPETDPNLDQPFSIDTLDDRVVNKIALQEQLGLEVNRGAFLVSMVTRLVEQKGLDIILPIIDTYLSYTGDQFLVLGTGEERYETQLRELADRYPGRMSVQLLYSDQLSRRIYAGSDAFLMPSRFEPCGISQMMAMRYGCVPIVRRTGGLVDTVSHHNPIEKTGTGYCFSLYQPLDLYTSLIRASESYLYRDNWRELQKRGMSQDFSWQRSAAKYVELYQDLIAPATDSEVLNSITSSDSVSSDSTQVTSPN
ncbi:MAG: glycogen synthase GlgA [Halothece sp.]